MKYQSVKGMEDLLPQNAWIWQAMERMARGIFEAWGFREIRTPILEDTAVFSRSIGETTDIVTKEMYTFSDRKGRSLTLRPEGTAPVVRAFIEHSLDKALSESGGKFYYIGPMFRAESPQKGRLRQFYQIGAEIIGSRDCQADIELIMQLDRMLKAFGLKDFSIKLNSLGCKKDKDNFAARLRDYFKDKKNCLCKDCNERIEKNVLRVLDCKNESCAIIAKDAPDVIESLCKECLNDFVTVKNGIQGIGIKVDEARKLVRGLDYYTGTIFEVTHPGLGSQDAIGAGGRYDNLVKEMGGPDVGAVGYAIGIERAIIALGNKMDVFTPNIVFFATLGNDAKARGLELAERIRKKFNTPYLIKVVALTGGIGGASLKSQMRNADKNNADIVVIIGDDELKAGKAVIRDMKTKEQVSVEMDDIVEKVGHKLC